MLSIRTTIRRLACTVGLALTAFAAIAGGAAGSSDADLCNARAQACMTVVANNAEGGVTWVHSYVSQDLGMTF